MPRTPEIELERVSTSRYTQVCLNTPAHKCTHIHKTEKEILACIRGLWSSRIYRMNHSLVNLLKSLTGYDSANLTIHIMSINLRI